MEFEVLNERVEWECKRIAAAFGVVITGNPVEAEVAPESADSIFNIYCCQIKQFKLMWAEEPSNGLLVSMSVVVKEARSNHTAFIWHKDKQQWVITSYGQSCVGLMQRVIYCLGFSGEFLFYDTFALSQPPTLTTHEKLELRLSLPREFWPKTWLGEVNKG